MAAATSLIITLFLLVSTAPLSLVHAQPLPAAGPDTVVIWEAGEPDILHPLFSDADSAGDVLETMFTRDVQRDDSWKAFPQGVEYIRAFIVGVLASCEPRYYSQSIPTEANGWTGGNFTGYRNPEMDEACGAATREVDEEKRIAALRQVARIFSRDLPALPLFWRVRVVAAKTGLQNFSFGAPFLGDEFWNAHAWFWK